MSEAARIIVPDGIEDPRPMAAQSDGSCPDCKAQSSEFSLVFGGKEVCMRCGHEREAAANG